MSAAPQVSVVESRRSRIRRQFVYQMSDSRLRTDNGNALTVALGAGPLSVAVALR